MKYLSATAKPLAPAAPIASPKGARGQHLPTPNRSDAIVPTAIPTSVGMTDALPLARHLPSG